MQRTVNVSQELSVPAIFLWQTISDFEHIDRWADLKVQSIHGKGIGCERTVEMGSGALVTERLLQRDEERMALSYEILAPNPFPMHDYRSTVSITEIAPGISRLEWIGCYVPAENTDPARSDNLLRKVYINGIKLLQAHFDKS